MLRSSPTGYLISGPRLMGSADGRQMPSCARPRRRCRTRRFTRLYAASPLCRDVWQIRCRFNPLATVTWVRPDQPELLRQIGTLYLPGPNLSEAARLRLRAGGDGYSLVRRYPRDRVASGHGRYHRLGSRACHAMGCPNLHVDSRRRDCTPSARGGGQLSKGAAWRRSHHPAAGTGHSFECALCGFRVLPTERFWARQLLHIDVDDLVVLFVGRLSFPYPMYAALEAAAQQTAKGIMLL
jgi:hypothetical protein